MLLPTLIGHQYRPRGSPVTSLPVGAPSGKGQGIFPSSTTFREALPSSDHDHVVHMNRTLGRSKWTKSFIDRLYGLWTNADGFTMNRASPAPMDHNPLVAQ